MLLQSIFLSNIPARAGAVKNCYCIIFFFKFFIKIILGYYYEETNTFQDERSSRHSVQAVERFPQRYRLLKCPNF